MSKTEISDDLTTFIHELAQHGRTDCYSRFNVRSDKGYQFANTEVTEGTITAHLSGRQPIAIYLFKDDTTRLAAFDVDNHNEQLAWEQVASKIQPLIADLKALGVETLVVRSGGGSGIHIWLVWQKAQNASDVRLFLKQLLRKHDLKSGTLGLSANEVEIYPKQDRVLQGKVGNPIALPFARLSQPLGNDLQPVNLADYSPPKIENLYAPDVISLPMTHRPEEPAEPTLKPAPINRTGVQRADEDETRSALKYIPADDYDSWIRIGLILKCSLAEGGFALWNDWSKSSTKYEDESKCLEKWHELCPDGSLGIGTLFHMAQQNGWNGPCDPEIREMNARYGILTYGGNTRIILKRKADGGQGPISWLSKKSFEDRLAGERIQVENNDGSLRKVSRAKHWLNHPQASHYYEIIFDPSLPPGHNGNRWNMWAGFSVQPAPGKWDRLQEHIFTNICSDNDEHYQWLLNWMACGVQKPDEVLGTAPVLAGLPGTGKGVLANAYGRLWGEHYVSVTKEDHITGRFNQHFMGKRFVYIDEGMFGGDRRKAGVIKTMITEPRVMLEAKGMDAFLMENHMIFMVTSNERSIVAADIGDRRWQMLSVGDKHREDRPYFAAIVAQLDEGGAEGMLHDLLNRDISIGPDPHRTFRTPELYDQIIQAQGPIEKYLYQVLDEGHLPQPDAPGNGAGVTTIAAMHDHMKRTQPRADYVQLPLFGRTLTKLFPGVEKIQSGQFVVGRDANGCLRTERSMRYRFPPLKQCRHLFGAFIGQEVPWSNDLEEWQGGDEFDAQDKGHKYPF